MVWFCMMLMLPVLENQKDLQVIPDKFRELMEQKKPSARMVFFIEMRSDASLPFSR